MGKALVAPQTTVEVVPLNLIKANDIALRSAKVEEKSFAELKQSIKDRGVLKPVLLNRNEDGTFTLIDGLQRFTAAQQIASENPDAPKTINAAVCQVESEEQLIFQIIANNNSVKTRPSEYAEAILRITMGDPTTTQAEIAERLSMSQATVSNMLNLTKLDPAIKKLVDDGSIPVTNAYALTRVPKEYHASFLEDAQLKNPGDFATAVSEFNKQLKAAKEGKPAPTGPTAKLRKAPEIISRYETLTSSIANNENPDPVVLAEIRTLAWCIQQDEASVLAWKQAKDAKEAERIAKESAAANEKAAAAAKAADEARAKMAAVTKTTNS
jgi:ParB/RepB/Spo0J family partition protein